MHVGTMLMIRDKSWWHIGLSTFGLDALLSTRQKALICSWAVLGVGGHLSLGGPPAQVVLGGDDGEVHGAVVKPVPERCIG